MKRILTTSHHPSSQTPRSHSRTSKGEPKSKPSRPSSMSSKPGKCAKIKSLTNSSFKRRSLREKSLPTNLRWMRIRRNWWPRLVPPIIRCSRVSSIGLPKVPQLSSWWRESSVLNSWDKNLWSLTQILKLRQIMRDQLDQHQDSLQVYLSVSCSQRATATTSIITQPSLLVWLLIKDLLRNESLRIIHVAMEGCLSLTSSMSRTRDSFKADRDLSQIRVAVKSRMNKVWPIELQVQEHHLLRRWRKSKSSAAYSILAAHSSITS